MAGLCEDIRTAYARLTRTERRVADVILADPEAALETATAQLAERAAVSQPQVIRFCRAIGFEGVTSFKRALAGSLALSRHGLARDGAAHPMLAHSISALARMNAHCDGAALRRAAAALAEARLVDVWADEAQRPFAELAVRALWRLGLHARPAWAGEAISPAARVVCLMLGAAPAARSTVMAAASAGQAVIVLCDSPQEGWSAATIQLCTGPEPEDTPALLALQMLYLLLGEVRRLSACNTATERQIPHARGGVFSYS